MCVWPQAINEALQGTSAPVKVLSGYFSRVTVSVPWTALLKDSCTVEISGLSLSVIPQIASNTSEEHSECIVIIAHDFVIYYVCKLMLSRFCCVAFMTDSLFFSMTSR